MGELFTAEVQRGLGKNGIERRAAEKGTRETGF